MLQPTLNTQQKAYISKLQSYGLVITPFSRNKRPVAKQFYNESHTLEQLIAALQDGYVLAIVNDGNHQFVDFDRGSAHESDDVQTFLNAYEPLLRSFCAFFSIGLHKSVHGFHLLGLPADLLADYTNDNVKITPRTKHQALILPFGRVEDGVLVPYDGVTKQITLTQFLQFLLHKRSIDGYTLELAAADLCAEFHYDIHQWFREIFGDTYDEQRTTYISERHKQQKEKITFGSVIHKLSPLYAHILKKLLPKRQTVHVKTDNAESLLYDFCKTATQFSKAAGRVSDFQRISAYADVLERHEATAEAVAYFFRVYQHTPFLDSLRDKNPYLVGIFKSFLNDREIALVEKAEYIATLRRARRHFLALQKYDETQFRTLFSRIFRREISQLEFEILRHFFTNLKKAVCYGEDVFFESRSSNEAIPRKVLLNFYGPQGTRKSTFVSKLVQYLNSFGPTKLSMSGNAKTFFEDRHTSAYSALKILNVLDELSYLSRTDQGVLKQRLENYLIYNRDICSSKQTIYANISNFVGTSNTPLELLLSDDTGARRFLEIEISQPILTELLDQSFWDQVFGSLDEESEKTYTPLIEAWQHQTLRTASPLELFVHNVEEYLVCGRMDPDLDAHYRSLCDYQRTAAIHEAFRVFAERYGYQIPKLEHFGRQIAKSPYFDRRVRDGFPLYKINLQKIRQEREENL